MRCKGSTTALISIMLANPKAIMIVHTAHVGDDYSKQYGIDRTRFFSIRNGVLEFLGRRIEGPILVDLPAIADVLEQVRMEQAEGDALKLSQAFERDDEIKRLRATTHQKENRDEEVRDLQIERNALTGRNNEQSNTIKRYTALLEELRMEKEELIRTNDKQFKELLKKGLYTQHLRNRNGQLMGAFSKIDAVLSEKLIDPIPEDSL